MHSSWLSVSRSESAKPETTAVTQHHPEIIPRSAHGISRANISPNALKVLYRLKAAGYQACLVGGGVRDLLLGREPKDFDVATDARPDEVRQLFRSCRLIGRRFRLAHVRFGREIIEVATFRAHHASAQDEEEGVTTEEGRILRDNVYGTIEEDAWRRDFTVNALYYDIADYSVLDYVGGMADLEAGVLRLIGDPEARYREDPVRMLRAARFAAKLGFRIHPESLTPIHELADLLLEIAPARLFDEVLKLFMGGEAVASYELLRQLGLFARLFPLTEAALAEEHDGFPKTLVTHALENTDTRIDQGKPVTPAFLFAALLWPPVSREAELRMADGESWTQALQAAAGRVLAAQQSHISVPRRFSLPMREIWLLQPRFEQRQGKRPLRLLAHPRFRAAYDFLLLRGQSGEVDAELCQWWTDIQEENPELVAQRLQTPARSGRRRRRGGRRRRPEEQGDG